jgi:APA family basic amino acid/polyamine antiporter
MLSFTTAHIAIIALRVKQPDVQRPYRIRGNIRWRGVQIPISAVVGGLGTFAAWISVVALHSEARLIGLPWMAVGLGGYFYYRRRQGLDPRAQHRIARAERPADFTPLGYRTALVAIFGADVSATTLVSAAKLIGSQGIVYAVYVLPVPRQLSLDAGLEAEEAHGRSILEGARIQGRRAGIKVRTGLIRARNPGAALADEAERIGADVIYLSEVHAPASEQGIGLTAAYLLDRRPCRIVIETDTPAARALALV